VSAEGLELSRLSSDACVLIGVDDLLDLLIGQVVRYARRVGMYEIEANDFNLNISRYVSTAEQEVTINLSATHEELVEIEKQIWESMAKHNAFLKELRLSPLPAPDK
jgi:type I restriction enzyme M protein